MKNERKVKNQKQTNNEPMAANEGGGWGSAW